jgi:hypothetical protein
MLTRASVMLTVFMRPAGWPRAHGRSRAGYADRAAAKVEQVLTLTQVASAAALPVADVRQGVLDRDTLAQPGPPVGGELTLAEFGQQPLVGWIFTLRPRTLVVH